MEASARMYLDKRKANKENKFPIKLCVTYERKRKYYSVQDLLTKNEWNFIAVDDFIAIDKSYKKDDIEKNELTVSLKLSERKDVKVDFDNIIRKANDIINEIQPFSFYQFETKYRGSKSDWRYVKIAFEERIKELNKDDKIGYAIDLNGTLTGMKYFVERKKYPKGVQAKDHHNFKKINDLKFSDITPDWLKNYENYLIKQNNRSKSTAGKHARNIRTMVNIAIKKYKIKMAYPFYEYSPVKTLNKKRPLNKTQLLAIASYTPKEGSEESFYRDLFLFSLVSSGMNLSDICRLQFKNIEGDYIVFVRKKNEDKGTEIKLVIKYSDSVKAIIKKHGNSPINNDVFIFPILDSSMDEKTKYRKITQLTKTLNNYLKKIAKAVGMEPQLANKISLIYARHSFATLAIQNKETLEALQSLFGHASKETTKLYVDSLNYDSVDSTNDAMEQIINVG